MSKQEPVAWQWLDTANFRKKLSESANKDEWTPLYTAPQTKPLSDEEIEKVIRKHWNKEYGNRNMLTLCKAVLKEAKK